MIASFIAGCTAGSIVTLITVTCLIAGKKSDEKQKCDFIHEKSPDSGVEEPKKEIDPAFQKKVDKLVEEILRGE